MHSLITDLFGPIFAKEMVEMARRWRYYQNRVLFGALVLFVLFVVYQNTYYRYSNSGGWTLQTLSKMAESFFLSYLWVQFLSVFFFVPFFLTGVIAGEREQKTLDLLFTTQLTNRDIIFGKLGSRVVSMVLLILSGVPIVALTMLFGGVNSKVFYHGMLGTFLALLYVSATAIYFSTITKTTLGALVRTYWWVICWVLLVPMLLMFAAEAMVYMTRTNVNAAGLYNREWQDIAAMVICVINPVAPFVVGLSDFLGFQLQRLLGNYYFYWMSLVTLLWSALLLFLAIRQVRKEPTASKLLNRIRRFIGWVLGFLLLKPLTSRIARRLPQSKADRWLFWEVGNPLWQRSRRAYVYDREQHLQRAQMGGWLLFFVVLLALVFLESNMFRYNEAAIFFMGWIWLGLAAIGCLTAGLSIVNDRRRGFFDLILVTPMTPFEVILGTFLAVWRHIKRLYLLVLVAMLIFVGTGQVKFSSALASVIIGTLALSLFILEGIACSMVARTVAGGLTAAFAIPLLLLLFLPMLGSVAREAVTGVYWTLCAALLCFGLIMTLYRKTSFSLMVLLLAMHFLFLCLFNSWVAMLREREYPLIAVHAGVMTLETLDDSPYHYRSHDKELWSFAKVTFCLATIANMLWLCWWMCRNYEVLAGRKEHQRKRRLAPAAIDPPSSSSKMSVESEMA
ncbi:MAG: ABC transporter permease subunit [Gemmatales bacterium]